MTKKTLIIWLLIVAFLGTMGFLYSKWDNVPTEVKKMTEEEIFLDKWEQIGQFKYMEMKAEKNAKEELDKAKRYKENKDYLLQELNGTGFQQ